jgi:hypothetical protein
VGGAEAPADPRDFVYPSDARLRALDEMVDLGYFRGILTLLDTIAAESPECTGFVAHLRDLARRFQLDAMTGVLRKARSVFPEVSKSARIVE